MLQALAVALAVLVVYVQALGGPLIWDDQLLIQGGEHWEDGIALADHLTRPLWSGMSGQLGTVSYYRPLVTLSFAFDHWLHGGNVGGYHLTNLIVHLGAALSLLALLRRYGVHSWTAAGLAACWALLPRLAEAGAWISGRGDALAGFFAFAGLAVWGPTLARRSSAALLLGAALFAKEVAAAAVVALCLAEWVRLRPSPTFERARRLGESLLPVLLVVGGYLVMRFSAVGFTSGREFGAVVRLRLALEAIATYAGMLLDPLRPRAVIGRMGLVSLAGTIVGSVVFLGGVVATWRLRARIAEPQALGLGLLVFGLFPVSHVLPIPLLTLAADRFLYIPAAGVVLLLASVVERAVQESRRARLLLMASILVLGAVTARRVAVWSDEIEFWVQTHRQTPRTNKMAVLQLAGVFFRAGRFPEALELTELGMSYDDPSPRHAPYNAAMTLANLGRPKEALELLLRGKARPLEDDVLLAASLQIRAGNFDRARTDLEPLAARKNRRAAAILRRLPAMETAYAELQQLGPHGDPLRRTQLAAKLESPPEATSAWVDATANPALPQKALLQGLRYLVQTGEREAIERARASYVKRFGPLDPELAQVVEVRLAELDRLAGVARELGLKSAGAKRP